MRLQLIKEVAEDCGETTGDACIVCGHLRTLRLTSATRVVLVGAFRLMTLARAVCVQLALLPYQWDPLKWLTVWHAPLISGRLWVASASRARPANRRLPHRSLPQHVPHVTLVPLRMRVRCTNCASGRRRFATLIPYSDSLCNWTVVRQ
jgi:hypothetical protein